MALFSTLDRPLRSTEYRGNISLMDFLGLVDCQRPEVAKLRWLPAGTDWNNFYSITSYSDAALERKKQLVTKLLGEIEPPSREMWDLGANIGRFSRIASTQAIPTIAFDIDPAAAERNYLEVKEDKETHILPLVLDLTNPSPGLGWENQERVSLIDRGPVDGALALALIHHLAVSNNLPLRKIEVFFGMICKWLIIESVPKRDAQVQTLFSGREDIFDRYDQENSELEFGRVFAIKAKDRITDTGRTLYLCSRKQSG